jgi:signal transduction histidine kinase
VTEPPVQPPVEPAAPRRRRWLRAAASIRLRSALAPALVIGLVLGGGAWWQRRAVYGARIDVANQVASSEVQQLAATYFHGDPGGIRQALPCWAVTMPPVGNSVTVVEQKGGGIGALAAPRGWDFPPEVGYPAGGSYTLDVDYRTDCFKPGEVRLMSAQTEIVTGREIRQRVWEIDWQSQHPGETVPPLPAGADPPPQRLTVWIMVDPRTAESAVLALDRTLYFGLPAVVLLVGALGWLVAGRALRPVEAMRRQLADITARRLGGRVPVPPDGNELRSLAVTTNETLDRLARAVQEQRRFVADAAHELRSPIAGMRNHLEVAVTHSGSVDWPVTAAAVLGGAKRLQALTDDLLMLARLDTVAPVRRPVDLGALACEAVAERDYLDSGGPVFAADVPAEPVLVTGDESALARMLRNLMDNAARHGTATAGVSVRAEDGTAWIEVVDDGPGIPVQARDRIFGRFTRLDDARSRDRGGAGLGLAIVRDIVTRHGGTVRVAASPVGARFVVRLPERPAAAPAPGSL